MPSDYTIIIEKLPVGENLISDEELIKYIEGLGKPSKPVKVVNVTRTYDIREIVDLIERKENLCKELSLENTEFRRDAIIK